MHRSRRSPRGRFCVIIRSMKIAVCLPSRGLIHSRTFEAVWINISHIQKLEDTEVELFFSHDQNIPDCFNHVAEYALNWGADFCWFVEEDMVPNDMALLELLSAEGDVRANDYLIDYNGQPVTKYDKDGEPIFTGMGSMLIPAFVLQKTLPFLTKYSYDIQDGEFIKKDWDPGYGGQDVYFCMQLKEMGYRLNVVGAAHHLRVEKLGMPGTNNGAHTIKAIQQA